MGLKAFVYYHLCILGVPGRNSAVLSSPSQAQACTRHTVTLEKQNSASVLALLSCSRCDGEAVVSLAEGLLDRQMQTYIRQHDPVIRSSPIAMRSFAPRLMQLSARQMHTVRCSFVDPYRHIYSPLFSLDHYVILRAVGPAPPPLSASHHASGAHGSPAAASGPPSLPPSSDTSIPQGDYFRDREKERERERERESSGSSAPYVGTMGLTTSYTSVGEPRPSLSYSQGTTPGLSSCPSLTGVAVRGFASNNHSLSVSRRSLKQRGRIPSCSALMDTHAPLKGRTPGGSISTTSLQSALSNMCAPHSVVVCGSGSHSPTTTLRPNISRDRLSQMSHSSANAASGRAMYRRDSTVSGRGVVSPDVHVPDETVNLCVSPPGSEPSSPMSGGRVRGRRPSF